MITLGPLSSDGIIETFDGSRIEYTSTETIANDIDRCFDTPSVVFQLYTGHKSAEWVLQWWQTNQAEYPCMARAARDYLPIPASEVDMERTFSDGRDILGIRRWRIKGNTFRTLILCRDYLKKQAEERAERRRRLGQ